ncbi:hypothetical protein [Streptomyces poonensis]|uniref:Uncharacterized protein n=1 Tax=Streptomyces poonensis TaxID=68255 RepID=A0A918PPK6_9ACTN|nr:hypothetical protein [Streptomyces poonensis]GGZ18164.1 hypothetical protein GCM10010365_42880 [Streptomyces poonensis]GLJ91068.1 hypothetical protein GCM10017589_36740 [Streptomyces poonensis]
MASRNDDRYEGVDALMAAITDEPLPEGALDDPYVAAEHRAALADVALLREQLRLIGGTLADAPARTEAEVRPLPVRTATTTNRRRRPFALALRTLAAAAAATVVVGMGGWLIAQGGAGEDSGSGTSSADQGAKTEGGDGSQTAAGYVACARLIAEGTVVRVEPVPGTGQDRITLDVERHYKPEEGEDEVVFPMDENADPRLREGDHVLVGISGDEATPDTWTVGEKDIADERARILDALPESESLGCE